MSEQPSYQVNQSASGGARVTQIGVLEEHIHYPDDQPPPQRTSVTLELAQEAVDTDKLLELIAGLTRIGIDDIRLVGVRVGSIIVTLDMPIEAARQLAHLARTRPDLFADFAVVSITVKTPKPPAAGGLLPGGLSIPGGWPLLALLIGGLVIVAVVIVLLTRPGDTPSPAPEPQFIACDSTVEGMLSAAQPEAVWRFALEGPAYVIGSVGSAFPEPLLSLHNAAGELIGEGEPIDDFSARWSGELPAGEYTFIIATRAPDQGASGQYILRLTCDGL